MHADREAAEAIADKIESRAYDGIPTQKILQMIFRYLKKHRPAVRHQIDLRMAISLLRPKPDFERFVQMLLEEHGYAVTSNRIIRGKCVEHEIDAIARKGGETYLVEIKHHFHTTPTRSVCPKAITCHIVRISLNLGILCDVDIYVVRENDEIEVQGEAWKKDGFLDRSIGKK